MTEQEKQRLLKLAAQEGARFTAPKNTAPKAEDNSLLDFALTTGLGALGGVAGTFVMPGLGTAAGGAAGAGLGKTVSNMIQGKASDEGVLGEAALGTLGGAGKLLTGVRTLGKGANAAETVAKPGILSKFGGFLETKGGDLAASQANLTRAQARTLGQPLSETFSNLQRRTGTANMDDLARLSQSVTGGGGSVTLGINKAVSPLGVDIGDLSKVADKSLANNAPAVFGAQRKALQENVRNSVVKAYGGSEGSLSSVVGGKSALDASKSFAEQAANYGNAYKRSGNVADLQTSKVYKELSGTITDRLYRDPNAVDNFLRTGKPQILADFRAAAKDALRQGNKTDAKAFLKLADDFQKNVTNIKDARTFQRDFVELGKINEKTLEASKGAAAQMGDNVQGAGRLVQKPTNLIALPLEAATPRISSTLMDIGRKLQGTAPAAAGEAGAITKGTVVKELLAQGVPRALIAAAGGGMAASALNEQMNPDVLAAMGADANPMDEASAAAAAAGMGGEDGRPPKDAIDRAILESALNGDKESMAIYKSLSDYFYPADATTAKESITAQKAAVGIQQAENSLNQLEAMSKKVNTGEGLFGVVTGTLNKAGGAVGLNPDAAAFNAQAKLIGTGIARALGQSGALSDRDMQNIQESIPTAYDNRETAMAKINSLRQLLQANAQSAQSIYGGGSLSSVFGG